jgi:hypothetical protein
VITRMDALLGPAAGVAVVLTVWFLLTRPLKGK